MVNEPGAICLVSTYELGHAPQAVAMAQGFLRRAGYRPTVLDLAIDAIDPDRLAAARVIAVSVPMHTALRLALDAWPKLRAAAPGAAIGFFGHYAYLHRQRLLDDGAAFVLAGELEDQLIAAIGDHAQTSALVSLDRLTFAGPDRTGLASLDSYCHFVSADGTTATAGYTETSRGCLDSCRHCPIPPVYGGRFFVVPRQVVLADIDAQVAAGARHITFGDPDFLNGPGHSLAIARELHRRHPGVTFDITAQVSHLLGSKACLSELVDLGCAFVTSAIESLSDRVLEALAKRHRRADIDRLIDRCQAAGLHLRPTLVAFTPWTELTDMVELIDYVFERDLIGHVAPVQLSIRLLVPPGSLLLDGPDAGVLFGPLDRQALGHRWPHADGRVDALQRDLAAAAQGAARAGTTGPDTLAAMAEIIYAHAGLARPSRRVHSSALSQLGPRLSEPWFC